MLEGKLAVTVAVEKFKDNDSRRAREENRMGMGR